MTQNNESPWPEMTESPCDVVREQLKGSEAVLTNFYFTYGGNLYVISYPDGGRTRHTLIDAGDRRFRDQVYGLLQDNEIAVADIENIVITHSHPDHCGLADELADKSGASIVVHHNFRKAIERQRGSEEERWWHGLNIANLARHDIRYMQPREDGSAMNISGLEFNELGQPLECGDAQLNILSCPETDNMHTADQIVVHYSPRRNGNGDSNGHFKPDDNLMFSGDLWLMVGPKFNNNFRPGHRRPPSPERRRYIRRHREQDFGAKDALKKGFDLIRVKPGHGNEFIGSRIIALSLLADRDILPLVGYSRAANKSLLRRENLAEKIAAIQDEAYGNFTGELNNWYESGYSSDDIVGFLTRIYREQSGGSKSVEMDRGERRVRLRESLDRLQMDKDKPAEMQKMARKALSALDELAEQAA